MRVHLRPSGKDMVLTVELELKDKDREEEGSVHLSASEKIDREKAMRILMDDQTSRSVAASLVGRLVTKWKLNLISGIDDALVSAVRQHYAASMRRRGAED